MRFLWPSIVTLLLCRSMLSAPGVCSSSLTFLAGEPVPLEWAELKAWTPEDYQRNVGHRFFAKTAGAASRATPSQTHDFAVGAQTLFSVEHLPPEEQRLIDRLYIIAHLRKNVGAHNVREFEKRVREWLDIARRNHIDLSESEIRERARERNGAREVEAGVWLFKLRSGKTVAAYHTSREENAIDSSAAMKAFNGLASKVNDNDVVSIQYFHNHPATAPLSRGDEVVLMEIKKELQAQGIRAPLQMFSVFERGGHRFAFGMEAK